MKYKILSEINNNFEFNGDVFEGTQDDAILYIQKLQESDGLCYSLELLSDHDIQSEITRREKVAQAFHGLPINVQIQFGPIFTSLSSLPSEKLIIIALKNLPVSEEMQPYKDAILNMLLNG